MDLNNSIDRIQAHLPQAEILAALAEEAAELAHAALKLRRAIDGTSPTPVTVKEALRRLMEEVADVELCIQTVSGLNYLDIESTMKRKAERWVGRLYDGITG